MFDRHWIAAHIPHQGSMCLLDEVARWSEHDIVCISHRHRDAGNPLQLAGRLGVACAIEFAAQTMAVHAALLAGEAEPPRAGYLTSVREVHWHCRYLDDAGADLQIEAERISGNEINAMYRFSLRSATTLLVTGRLGVVLDAAGLAARIPSH